jgi:hypothetical protein
MMASDFFPSKHGDFGAYFPKNSFVLLCTLGIDFKKIATMAKKFQKKKYWLEVP